MQNIHLWGQWTAGGNARLVEALTDGLHIEYNSVVDRVQYAGNGVKVHAGGRVYDGVRFCSAGSHGHSCRATSIQVCLPTEALLVHDARVLRTLHRDR